MTAPTSFSDIAIRDSIQPAADIVHRLLACLIARSHSQYREFNRAIEHTIEFTKFALKLHRLVHE